MTTITPTPLPQGRKPSCPHCGKSYRTLLTRQYGLQIDAHIKQSIPLVTRWRCLACGKSYSVEGE